MSCLNKRIQFTIRLRKNGRRPSNFPLDGGGTPLRITRIFPMKLKEVSLDKLEASKKESDVVCISEMMSLFDCYEKHDFTRGPCQQYISALEHCYSSFRAERGKMKSTGAKTA